ncbi:hypothetical protein KKB18_00325 [bacterium]|nr:hypothetical protein [bacterium]
MNWRKIIICGVLVWIVNFLIGWVTCGCLFNWVYELPPDIWKDPETMKSGVTLMGLFLTGILSALIFAGVFAFIYKGIPGTGIKKGVIYGFIVWLVGALSGIASMGFFMTIATTVLIYWIVQALVMNIINGAVIGAIYKEK